MNENTRPPSHINADQTEWTTNPAYPEALQQVVRWKILIGAFSPEGIGIPQDDVLMGVLDLDAGGYYPAHSHPAPEIYFILSGSAEWTVGEETFTAQAGMAIYHPPNVAHRMVNNGAETLKTVWFWWGPDGQREVMQVGVTLLEDMP